MELALAEPTGVDHSALEIQQSISLTQCPMRLLQNRGCHSVDPCPGTLAVAQALARLELDGNPSTQQRDAHGWGAATDDLDDIVYTFKVLDVTH